MGRFFRKCKEMKLFRLEIIRIAPMENETTNTLVDVNAIRGLKIRIKQTKILRKISIHSM